MQIGAYHLITDFATAGSGNARWCIAEKNGRKYFVKQFLSPVQPVQTTEFSTELIEKRRKRCAVFERTKSVFYESLSRLHNGCAVRVEDFFVHEGHYFTVSEYIDPAFPTFEIIKTLPKKMAAQLLFSMADCLREMHQIGVVHADLKPEHIIVDNRVGSLLIRIIDFDSGFLETCPPQPGSNIEVDPVYLSPEAYRLIIGEAVTLNRKLDTFAQGIFIHQALTGSLPLFDETKYAYLYACILDNGSITLSDQLDRKQQMMIRQMLNKNPAKRPGDDEICDTLKASVR